MTWIPINMKSLEYHPHSADVLLVIVADELPELFEAGLLGMSGVLKKDLCQQPFYSKLRYEVEIKAPDVTALLIDFLSEVLTIGYIKQAVFCEIEIMELSQHHMKASVYGQYVDSLDQEIKAVTYHQAHISKGADQRWNTNIIFDI